MPARLIVFDLDGTLIDSRRDLADSANQMLASYGAPPLGEEEVGKMVGSGAAQLVRRALRAAHVTAPLEDALARFLRLYDDRLTIHTRPYAGVPEMLRRLNTAGTKLALLTNKPLGPSIRILEAFDLARYFVRSIGGDGPWPRKPSPAGLIALVTEQSERPDTTVLVGDSEIDLQTARNAGVRFCLARYGFGFSDRLLEAVAPDDLVLDDPLGFCDAVGIVDHTRVSGP
jgi:phosphoglycolate phosphatase